MKYKMTTALAALLGTTLLPATALGFEEVNTNPADGEIADDIETSDSRDEDPFTDAGAEVDADTTNPDNPEITDADSTTTVNPQITDATEEQADEPDPIEDITGVTPVMSHMDPVEDDVESSDSIENETKLDTGNDPAQPISDQRIVDAPAAVAMPEKGAIEDAVPTQVNGQITDAVAATTVNPQITGSSTQTDTDPNPVGEAPAEAMGDTADEVPTEVNPQITDAVTQAREDMATIDPDPTVEEEDDEAVPGPGDMEEQISEMNEEEGGA